MVAVHVRYLRYLRYFPYWVEIRGSGTENGKRYLRYFSHPQHSSKLRQLGLMVQLSQSGQLASNGGR
jgi:hypothetical protein